ncbi:MAG: toprim domain-containing protein, partial [Clostridia bacterium]
GGREHDFKISKDFLPNNIKIETKLGTLFLWLKYDDSTSVSFVNGSSCGGIHQKIVNDWINEYFNYNLAHHFYDTLFILNVPSKLMRFGDQNKTRYAVTRNEIEPIIESAFKKKILQSLNKSEIADAVKQEIEKRLYADNLKKIKSAQKTSKRKISDKYIAPSKRKSTLYVTEGASATGSISQARASETDGLYSLRGKVKNAKHLSDLTQNKEILDLMSILEIDPASKKTAAFEKIVIATDPDPDGIGHICPLLINFFFKWFPQVIENKQLYVLSLPLVVCTHNKERKYFYSNEEFNDFLDKGNKPQSINYLKGLGSLSVDDWKFVMKNRVLYQIHSDSKAGKYLDIAFGESTQKRKKWLSSDNI